MEKILIVEDQKTDQMLFKLVFGDDFEVTVMDNGFDALRYLEDQPVDLVLTDLKMPGMSGVDLAERIKQLYPGLPVIAITAQPEYFYNHVNMEAFFEDLISKPMDLNDLKQKVELLLRHSS